MSANKEKAREKERQDYIQSQLNEIWSTIPKGPEKGKVEDEDQFPKNPHENILYFVEKNAPNMEPWKREIIRIVRKIS